MAGNDNNVGGGDCQGNGETVPTVLESGFEEPATAPASNSSKCFKMTFFITPAIFNILDTASDCRLAHEYYKHSMANSSNKSSPYASHGPSDYLIFFYYTVSFIVFPALLVTFINSVFYLLDRKREGYKPPSKKKICCIVIHTALLQCPLLRDFEVLFYGMKLLRKPNDPRYLMKLKKAQYDSAFLRLFEKFTEDAPQALLQLYIYYTLEGDADRSTRFWQFVSVMSSLVSLAWMVTSYNDTARTVASKEGMSWFGKLAQLLWHFFIISSSVVAWSQFANSTFFLLVAVTGTSYWLAVLIYVRYERRRRGEDSEEDKANIEAQEFYTRTIISNHNDFYLAVYDFFVDCTLAFAYAFDVIKIRNMPMMRVYLVFYGITFLKYVFLFCLAPGKAMSDSAVPSLVLFLIGLFFMFLYYKCSHPKKSCCTCS